MSIELHLHWLRIDKTEYLKVSSPSKVVSTCSNQLKFDANTVIPRYIVPLLGGRSLSLSAILLACNNHALAH